MFILDKAVAFLCLLCELFDVTPEAIAKSKGVKMPQPPTAWDEPEPGHQDRFPKR